MKERHEIHRLQNHIIMVWIMFPDESIRISRFRQNSYNNNELLQNVSECRKVDFRLRYFTREVHIIGRK